jgi:hypothetical protein
VEQVDQEERGGIRQRRDGGVEDQGSPDAQADGAAVDGLVLPVGAAWEVEGVVVVAARDERRPEERDEDDGQPPAAHHLSRGGRRGRWS